MQSLNMPLSPREFSETRELLYGNISRICISNDTSEILSNLFLAIDCLMRMSRSNIISLNEE